MDIIITRENCFHHSKSQKTWDFQFESNVVLISYSKKVTKIGVKDDFVISDIWNRSAPDKNTLTDKEVLALLPQDVIEEVIDTIKAKVNGIEVKSR